MDMPKNDLYEDFHKNTSYQKKVISSNNFTYRHIIEIIDAYIKPSSKILDIGCGAGTVSLFYAKKGYKVTGVDISKTSIETCKKSAKFLKLKNIFFGVMDFPRQYPNKKYDLIICTEVLEHLSDDRKALKTIYKMIKNNGIAVISTPSKNAPLFRLGLATDFDKKVGHLRRYTVEELVGVSKKCGFMILDIKKTEGILRNFLFLNPYAGKLVRFIKYFLSDIVTFLDTITLFLFGESNIFVVMKKK